MGQVEQAGSPSPAQATAIAVSTTEEFMDTDMKTVEEEETGKENSIFKQVEEMMKVRKK